tara:strand:+ start:232 stop:393 length:162 start_codon:yes stop_codon:yes gene_type:complete
MPIATQAKEEPSEQVSYFVIFIEGNYGMVKESESNFPIGSIGESRGVELLLRS